MKAYKNLFFGTALILGILGFNELTTHAGGKLPEFPAYTQSQFDQAQREGKLTAVNFHDTWCGNCKAQAHALHQLLAESKDFKDVVVLHADFDETKELQKKMNVEERTQILLFKNSKEVGRITSKSKDKIAESLRVGLQN